MANMGDGQFIVAVRICMARARPGTIPLWAIRP